MAKVEFVVSNVLMKVEDIKDSLKRIKSEMIASQDRLNEQLMEEFNGAIREALGKLVQKNETFEVLVELMQGEIKKLKSELSSIKASKDGVRIHTWEAFWREFKLQFYSKYANEKARSKLRRLTKCWTVHDYVCEFVELILQISNMGESEALFSFLDGLKLWLKMELQRKDSRPYASHGGSGVPSQVSQGTNEVPQDSWQRKK
ncbi:hypothetical protein CXB51_012842 [Gossypium anomalum]|uniref:Retrotransposon gag domain-containing protein n=1 Tax=Gossypium anomalum TaxID=47600 RepID=A0A8J5Z5Z7_9ROSI|nr:hypothetical protein CXB51_012842 [Gossypium anomalum]